MKTFSFKNTAIILMMVSVAAITGCSNQGVYRGAASNAGHSVQYKAQSNPDGTQSVTWECDASYYGDRACAEMAKSHTSHTSIRSVPDPYKIGENAAKRASQAVN